MGKKHEWSDSTSAVHDKKGHFGGEERDLSAHDLQRRQNLQHKQSSHPNNQNSNRGIVEIYNSFCNKALLKYNCIRYRRWTIESNYCFIGLQERRNMSEETTTTTTSEDVDDNAEGKYFSSRQGFRKTIANPGKGVHNTASVSGSIDSPISIQNSSSTSRKKDHHHHHHHHHHHG